MNRTVFSSLSHFFFLLCLTTYLVSCQPATRDNTAEAEAPQETTEAPTGAKEAPPATAVNTAPKVETKPLPAGEPEAVEVTTDLIGLEATYTERLAPIASLKTTHPDTYWFIVSWFGTNYKSPPKWDGFNDEDYEAWQVKTKERGIDCSGFSRVMLDRIFDKQVAGGSTTLLNKYSEKVERADAQMGDLVFFKSYGSDSDYITHVGVYLMEDQFVHATSTRSAAKGLGLNVNHLDDDRWKGRLVAVGRVKGES